MSIRDKIVESISVKEVLAGLSSLGLAPHGPYLAGSCPGRRDPRGQDAMGRTACGGKIIVNPENGVFACFACGLGGDVLSLSRLSSAESPVSRGAAAPEGELDDSRGPKFYQRALLLDEIVRFGRELVSSTDPADRESQAARMFFQGLPGAGSEIPENSPWLLWPGAARALERLTGRIPEAASHLASLLPNFPDAPAPALACRDRGGLLANLALALPAPTDAGGRPWRFELLCATHDADLFSLDACAKRSTVLLVEDYGDAAGLMALGQANVAAVGPGGLVPRHLEGLRIKSVERVILAFDNAQANVDAAGRRHFSGADKTAEAVRLLRGPEFFAFVVDPFSLDPWTDPGEFAREEGLDAFADLAAGAEESARWMAGYLLKRFDLSTDLQMDALLRAAALYALRATEREAWVFEEAFLAGCAGCGRPEREMRLRLREARKRAAGEVRREALSEALSAARAELSLGRTGAAERLLSEASMGGPAERESGLPPRYRFEDFTREILSAPEGLSSGFSALDRMARIRPGALVLAAARPGPARTAFLLNLFLNMIAADPDREYHYFSFEEQKAGLALSCLTRLAGETLDERRNLEAYRDYLRKRQRFELEPGESRERVETAVADFQAMQEAGRLNLADRRYAPAEIPGLIRRLGEAREIGALFFDPLQRMAAGPGRAAGASEIAALAGALQEAAGRSGLPVIAGICPSLNPAREEPGAVLDALKEWAANEQAASLILGLVDESQHAAASGTLQGPQNALGGVPVPKGINLAVHVLKDAEGETGRRIVFKLNKATLAMEEKSFLTL